MKLSSFKRILKESLPSEQRDLADALGRPINDFTDEIFNAFQGNITVTDQNLNDQYKDLTFSVDSTGNPTMTLQYKSTLKTKTIGIIVVRVQNLTNPSIYPTGAPFITFVENSGLITIQNITGLSPNNKYQVTIRGLGL